MAVATLKTTVSADLEGNGSYIDFTNLGKSSYIKYGRFNNSLEYKPGSGSTAIEFTDNWISPNKNEGLYEATTFKGKDIRILVENSMPGEPTKTYNVFQGFMDNVEWSAKGKLSVCRIEMLDAFSKLARKNIYATSVPQENTGDRIQRILDTTVPGLPKWIRNGEVICPPISLTEGNRATYVDSRGDTQVYNTQISGTVLRLLRKLEVTEGGQFCVTHGRLTTLTPPGDGRITFFERGRVEPTRAVISYRAQGRLEASFINEPVYRFDSSIQVNHAIVTDVNGNEWSARDEQSIIDHDEYVGTYEVFSGPEYAQGLANWYVNRFGKPIPRISEIKVRPHLETYYAANTLLPLTIGSGVNIDAIPPGSDTVERQTYYVDGVIYNIRHLDPKIGSSNIEITYRLWPLAYTTTWELDASVLDEDTYLAPLVPINPGRIRWNANAKVDVQAFSRGILHQQVAIFGSIRERDLAERNPVNGSVCVIGNRVYIFTQDAWNEVGRIE